MISSPIKHARDTPSCKIDEVVVKKVAKATALAKKLGPTGFKIITPPSTLNDKVKPSRNPRFNPIEAAEKNLNRLSSGFKMWLSDDLSALKQTFKIYAADPDDAEKFQSLSQAIHTIKGNAPILGCEAAGMLASPLTDLLEGCADYTKMRPVLTLAIGSICHTLENEVPIDDPILLDTVNVLEQLKSSCQKGAMQQRTQAAGSANRSIGSDTCASGASCSSNANCSGTCPGTGP